MKNLIFVLAMVVLLAGCGGENPTPTPAPPPNPPTPNKAQVQIGTPAVEGMAYSWSPAASLDHSDSAQPYASPVKTTTYTVSATSKCGVAKSTTVVHVFKVVNGELVEIK